MKILLSLCVVLLAGCQAEVSLQSKPKESSKPALARPTIQMATTAGPLKPELPAKDDSPACMCNPEALKDAVLERIWESGLGQEIYNSQQRPNRPTRSELAYSQKEIDRLSRYRDKLKDHCLQDAYSFYVSFFQGQHDDGVENLDKPEPSIRDTEEEEREARKREVAECKRRGTVPRLVNP